MAFQEDFPQPTICQRLSCNNEDLLRNHSTQKSTLTLMVATDLHLGYKERHPILKNDSFEAFEEILNKAKHHNVDFLLLGGDFFHDANPSYETLHKSLSILRENTSVKKK